MTIRDARIELQKIALDFEYWEHANKGQLIYLPDPVISRLENITRDILRSIRLASL